MGLSPSLNANRPIRNETKRPCPLLMGHGRVCTAPKALAGGTAAPQATGPCSWACRRRIHKPPHSERNEAPMPPARGAWARLHGAEGSGRRHCRPPAHGPVAVCSHHCPIRTETKQARPLLVGRACVTNAPKALAADTVGPLLVGRAFVDLEPTALAVGTAVTRGSWSRRRNRPCGRLRG